MLMAIGDIHLGALSQHIPDLWKKQLQHLQRVLNYAVDSGVQHVFLMGDVFDTAYPTNKLVIALRRCLSKYPELTFYIIIGNHDWESSEHHALQWLHDLGTTKKFNFHVFTKPRVITVAGVKLFVCPHPYIMESPKPVHWCLGHFAWNNAKSDHGKPIPSGNSPRGRWILGDFHTHQNGKRYVYIGSLSQITWHEQMPKGIITFDREDWRFQPFTPTYRLAVKEISEDAELQDLDKDCYWSIRTVNNYTLPSDYKLKHHHIVHLSAARKRQDIRASVLLSDEDNTLTNPLQLLPEHLKQSKLSLTPSERKLAMKLAKRMYMGLSR